MLALTLSFCLIATGECKPVHVPGPYATVDECRQRGDALGSLVEGRMREEGYVYAGYTCTEEKDR